MILLGLIILISRTFGRTRINRDEKSSNPVIRGVFIILFTTVSSSQILEYSLYVYGIYSSIDTSLLKSFHPTFFIRHTICLIFLLLFQKYTYQSTNQNLLSLAQINARLRLNHYYVCPLWIKSRLFKGFYLMSAYAGKRTFEIFNMSNYQSK